MTEEMLKGEPVSFEHRIREFRPDVVGFSVLNGNRWPAVDFAEQIKGIDPDIKVVFGGPGATFLWEHILHHFPQVDYVVTGEGERAFLELLEFLKFKRAEEPHNIKGVAFRAGGVPAWNGPSEPIDDLSTLPIPSRYFDYEHVSSTRGCLWNCRFCGSPSFWGKSVRYRDEEHFVQEIELLYRKGRRFLYFSDDNFTINKERAISICKRIIEKGLDITWFAISRVDMVDEEVLYWMRRAGCIQISYGVESGSSKVRKALGKPLSTNKIKDAFRMTRRMGILPRAYFIYGAPGEDDRVIEETICLIDEIRPLSVIFYILDVFPGTQLYEELKDSGLIDDDYWLNRTEGIMYFYFEKDVPVSEKDILERGRRLRSTFYRNLPRYAESIRLIDKKELYPFHADFLSRLGMTFSHGDYSRLDEIPEPDAVAERLYKRALEYAPDHRAYLGLGIIMQKQGRFSESLEMLDEGLRHFPESDDLHISKGVSLMNLERYEDALLMFNTCPEKAKPYILMCQKKL